MIARINFRPYIKDPSLLVIENVLASLKEELKIYETVSRARPEYLKYVQDIKKEIQDVKKELKLKNSFKRHCTN